MDEIRMSGQQAGTVSAAQKAPAEVAGPAEKEAGQPSIHDLLQQAREKGEQRRDSLKLRTNGRQYGDAAMTAYAKLARARSQGDVSAAAGYARRQIARLRAALGTDTDNATRIKGAIRQLEKAVGRAGKKGRELRREELIRIRQKKAQREQARRKAAGLGQELNRRRTLRMIREGGYLREAEIDNRQHEQMAKTELELRQQAQALGAAAAPSLESAAREYAAAAETPAPAPEVSVEA